MKGELVRHPNYDFILVMTEEELIKAAPWTSEIVFNTTLAKNSAKDLGELPKDAPDDFVESSYTDENGHILPNILLSLTVEMIESDYDHKRLQEKAHLYCLLRMGQLRGISPLVITDEEMNEKKRKRKWKGGWKAADEDEEKKEESEKKMRARAEPQA
ncbi:hypothetical protein TrST_g11022 [Triparma strigata]|uniref:Uncharacterized protein n=1 Tax=Triparma strigata TaxID=1606541 RepID=A0A9W7DQP8_9STRA|nr:hypothetical protein TrST_g11022 [Triparma strigata]